MSAKLQMGKMLRNSERRSYWFSFWKKKSLKMPLVFHGSIQESYFCLFSLDIMAAQQTSKYEGKDEERPPAVCALSLSPEVHD